MVWNRQKEEEKERNGREEIGREEKEKGGMGRGGRITGRKGGKRKRGRVRGGRARLGYLSRGRRVPGYATGRVVGDGGRRH